MKNYPAYKELMHLVNAPHKMGLDTRKPVFVVFANNKGADQPEDPCRLISPFVIRLLESIMSRFITSKLSIF